MNSKYRTNYFVLFILVILTLGISLGVLKKEDKEIYFKSSNSNPEEKHFLVGKIGNLNLIYPDNTKINFPESDYMTLTVTQNFLSHSENEIIRDKNFPISIIKIKDLNSKKLSIQDWWEKDGPENEPHANIPEKEEVININGVEGYKATYYTPMPGFSPYYIPVQIYFTYGTDIYEIRGYQLPENPDPALTPGDIKAAQEYEKIFNQMLQSIHFTD